MTAKTPPGRWTCEVCRKKFDRHKSGDRPIRFCGQNCYHVWTSTNKVSSQFKKGMKPWNKELKGIHLSPATEFKKGRQSNRVMPVGSVTIRRRVKDRHDRAFVKIAEPSTWKERAIFVWEEVHGTIPRGWIVHHRDRNPLNDDIENLEAMTRADHAREHVKDRKYYKGIKHGK